MKRLIRTMSAADCNRELELIKLRKKRILGLLGRMSYLVLGVAIVFTHLLILLNKQYIP